MAIRAAVDSVIERAFGRPRLARDRVLLATSDDGLTWRKHDGIHITHPSHRRSHMTYFTAFDSDGRLWVRASLWDAASATWHTELGHGRRWFDVRPLGVDHLYAPRWDGSRLYGIVTTPGEGTAPACFRTGRDHEPVARLAQEWEALDTFPVMHDLWLTRVGERRVVAFVSAGRSDAEVAVHRWESHDGTVWSYEGEALASPFSAGHFRLADGPCVVAVGDGSWRMYFRSGERLVLGNTIRSARSGDLERWSHEAGDRIGPGGRWDSHGAGFPHVWRDERANEWLMHYAGYWGATRRAAAAEERWRRAGEQLLSS
jgi:hypothetical protein